MEATLDKNIAYAPLIRPAWRDWMDSHPFMAGMGSVMNLGGVRPENAYHGLFSADADAIAILSDWEAIGGDFFSVMSANPVSSTSHGA